MLTRTWSGFGFYGSEKGKLKHPAGLLVDDVGNDLFLFSVSCLSFSVVFDP
jgi:hypothetical protein